MVRALRRGAQRQRDLRAGVFRYAPSRRRRVDGDDDDATIGRREDVCRRCSAENPAEVAKNC